MRGNPVLNGLWARISRQVSITTTPAGADVSLRLIGGNTTWHPVGRTPLVNIRLPRGVFWWRLEKAGYEPMEIVRAPGTVVLPGFDGVVPLPTAESHPPDMVAVSIPPAGIRLTLTGFDYTKDVPAPDYYIDRHEVTNAEFKAFVDAGGYGKREYWTEPFVREGQTLDWTAAMALFRDGTGRPGPSTWQGGTYPAGREDWPVAAVSWYEAAAYAAFRGKHLPTIYHWTHAARPELGNSITRSSNFGGGGTGGGGHRARSRAVRDRRHGRQRQGVGLERADRHRQALHPRRRVERSGLSVSLLGFPVAVRPIRHERVSLHGLRRRPGATGLPRRAHRAAGP